MPRARALGGDVWLCAWQAEKLAVISLHSVLSLLMKVRRNKIA
jgi:hypothetical protein